MTEMPDVMPGSFCSIDAMKPSGYHEPPAAAGARQAKFGCPISGTRSTMFFGAAPRPWIMITAARAVASGAPRRRSEEHTSELQSRENLVCRLLLEKKKNNRGEEYLMRKKKKTSF